MLRLLRRSRIILPVVALALALLAIVGSTFASSRASAADTTKQIATATLGHDFRVTLQAVQGSGGGATISVAAFEFIDGAWKSLGRQTVGDPNGWLWPVVTDGGAICRFATSDVDPYPIEVRLLLSPSIGCSPATYNFHVDTYDELVPG